MNSCVFRRAGGWCDGKRLFFAWHQGGRSLRFRVEGLEWGRFPSWRGPARRKTQLFMEVLVSVVLKFARGRFFRRVGGLFSKHVIASERSLL